MTSSLRIREIRKRLGLTLEQVAKRAGTHAQQIHKLEQGDRRLTAEWMMRLSEAFGCDPSELLPSSRPPMVPVVGYVGAGAEVYATDDHAKGAGLDEVEAPPGMAGQSMVAVRVRGDSMLPVMQDGWVIYYQRQQDGVPDHCLNKLCVARLRDGPTLVKLLRRGYRPGCFNLFSTNAALMEDAQLEWAAPVLFIKPA